MSVLLLPNTFKGTLTNVEVSDILAEEIHKVFPSADVLSYPFSDGGNNMIESYLRLYPESQIITKKVQGPDHGQQVDAVYLIHKDIAYIESAKACGILLSRIKNPFLTTSYGLGELIQDALNHHVREIRIGLGGSATNDGGCGMLKALGCIFYSKSHKSFLPLGRNLSNIARIDPTAMDVRLKSTPITVLSDVTNPLLGKDGASYVFANQKGCDPKSIWKLEKGMENYSFIVSKYFRSNMITRPGAGAAGGLGYALMQFMNARTISGADSFLQAPVLKEALQDCDVIITGEGHLDKQTFEGKGISRILNAVKNGEPKPIIVIAGKTDKGIVPYALEQGILAVYPLNNRISHRTPEEKKRIAGHAVRKTMELILRNHPEYFQN